MTAKVYASDTALAGFDTALLEKSELSWTWIVAGVASVGWVEVVSMDDTAVGNASNDVVFWIIIAGAAPEGLMGGVSFGKLGGDAVSRVSSLKTTSYSVDDTTWLSPPWAEWGDTISGVSTTESADTGIYPFRFGVTFRWSSSHAFLSIDCISEVA